MTLPNVPVGIGSNGESVIPPGATLVVNNSGNQANATATAAMPAVPGKTNYITMVIFTWCGATAAGQVTASINNVGGTSIGLAIPVPAGAAGAGGSLVLNFNPPLPANGPNAGVNAQLPALGAGNLNAAVAMIGYVV